MSLTATADATFGLSSGPTFGLSSGHTYGLSFLAPNRLVLLVLPALLAAGYVAMAVRRRRYALRFTSLDLLDEVAPDTPGWRRHVPALVLFSGAVVASLAVARPAVAEEQDEARRIVVLAIDTSLSMEATDVTPSRVEAAKEAAGTFLDSVPEGVAVGVVGFDGQARQLIAPTTRLDAVRRVIDRAQLGEGTAIGEAVHVALQSIDSATEDLGEDEELAAGTIVLLSDGETTNGRSNEDAAAEARDAGIAVNTIAFGTANGSVTDPGGERIPVPVNPAALKSLATTTGGKALTAETASELQQVYEELGKSVEVTETQREITDWFAFAALALVFVAGLGSLLWFGRLP